MWMLLALASVHDSNAPTEMPFFATGNPDLDMPTDEAYKAAAMVSVEAFPGGIAEPPRWQNTSPHPPSHPHVVIDIPSYLNDKTPPLLEEKAKEKVGELDAVTGREQEVENLVEQYKEVQRETEELCWTFFLLLVLLGVSVTFTYLTYNICLVSSGKRFLG